MPSSKRSRALRCRSVIARSLAQFVNITQALLDDWSDLENAATNWDGLAHIWFRGHADIRWMLTPKIFRTKNDITVSNEEELFAEFVRRGGAMSGLHDPWQCYFLMQHHGIPTRLLDWSDSALVALYFALREGKGDAAVWAINPMWLNSQTAERYGLVDPRVDLVAAAFRVDAIRAALSTSEEKSPLLSLAVRPPIVSSRMFGQRSLFTLHGSQDRPIEGYKFVNRQAPICRIVIPKRCRGDLMTGMRLCGITETTVFPDLDGLAKELVREYGGW